MSDVVKYLDEEDVAQAIEDGTLGTEEPAPIQEPTSVHETDTTPAQEPTEEPVEESNWMEQAKKEGWVPDHVRAKHANKARVLEDKVENLEKMVQATLQPVEEDPNYDPDMPVTAAELRETIESMQQTQQDPALLSEQLMRINTPDYDEVILEHVEPLAKQNPWLADFLRGKSNPAKAAYELGAAVRDGREINVKLGAEGMEMDIAGDVEPVAVDKSTPPVEALEQARKQPKSLDEVPVATPTEVTGMKVEDFFQQSTERLMEIRSKNPDLYRSMQEKFHGKYA